MLAPSRPRHIGIQLAAALMFACTVMNLTFFIKLIDELWTAGHHHARRQIDTQRVCVLVVGGDQGRLSVNGSIVHTLLPSSAAQEGCSFYFLVGDTHTGWILERSSYLREEVDCVDCVFLCDLHQDLFLQSGFSKAEDCSSGMVHCPCRGEGGEYIMRGLERIHSSWKVSQI